MLETRRLRGNLLEVFKIVDVDLSSFFKISSSTKLRGHSLNYISKILD